MVNQEDGSVSKADARKPPKESFLNRAKRKTGLKPLTLILMFKGACPPVVALALYQWQPFATFFTTLGYLVAIAATLSMAMQPRAKFMQTMIFNILGICIGGAIAMLASYCAVSARINTTFGTEAATSNGPSPGATTVPYNSSACAVAAIWLLFNITIANAARFARPQLQVPIMLYSIFAGVSGVYAPQFPDMTVAESFVKKLLLAFIAGFAIATIINLFVFPITSRQVVLAQMGAYLASIKAVLEAEKDYLVSMETLQEKESADTGSGSSGKLSKVKTVQEKQGEIVAATKGLKDVISGVTTLHGKLAQDLTFAKREVAFGKLDAKDLDEIYKLLRLILLPCLGLSSVVDIFQHVADGRGWNDDKQDVNGDEELLEKVRAERAEWIGFLKTLHEPFAELVEGMSEGLTHVSYTLQFSKKPKTKAVATGAKAKTDSSSEDVEAKAGSPPVPG